MFKHLVFISILIFAKLSGAAGIKPDPILNQVILENNIPGIRQSIYLKHDFNRKDAQGFYPLHVAMNPKVKEATLSFVLAAGAHPDVKNNLGQTPLHVAVAKGFVKKVKILLDAGADANIQNSSGDSALHLAVNGRGASINPKTALEMTNLILQTKRPDINLRGHTALTPLISATTRINPSAEVVHALLQAGADSSLISLRYTALEFAEAMLRYFKKINDEEKTNETEKIVSLLKSNS